MATWTSAAHSSLLTLITLHRIRSRHPPLALLPQAIHHALTLRNVDTHPPLALTPQSESGQSVEH